MPDQSVRFDAEGEGYTRASTGLASVDHTVAMWVYLVSHTGNYMPIYSFDSGGYSQVQTNGGGMTLTWYTGGGAMGSAVDLTVGAWHYVATVATTAASVETFYQAVAGAGSLSSVTGAIAEGGIDSGWTLKLGKNGFGDAYRWNGRIAQVKIWSAALSQAELEAEMTADSVVRTADLWAYYSFRDGPQTTDESGNGRTLTTLGTPTAEDGPPVESPVTGAYTELEWNLKLQAPATISDIYEFRVYAGDTPLTDYPVTAQLSVESAGVNYDETGRSITIAASTTATDQADWKSNVGLSIPVVATTTATDQADWKSNVALPISVVATTAVTTQYDHRELALSITIVASTTTPTDQADFKEPATLIVVPIVAEITVSDSLAHGGNFDDFGLPIPITAGVSLTDQADFKDLGLSCPVTATTTLPIDRYERYDLARSISLVATVTTPTDQADFKELALPLSITATTTTTTLIKRGELARSISVVATTTVPTDKRKNFETALAVSVTATTTTPTDQADFKTAPALDLSITATVTCADNQQSPGHYEDTDLPITIAASVATVIEQTDYKDLARSIPVVASTTVTALKHFYATGLSIPLVATVAPTALHKRFEVLALPVASTVALPTDQADFNDLTFVNVAATVTLLEGVGALNETGRQILITATVNRTDRADFNDLAKALDVVAGVSLTDQADYHQLLAVLVMSTIRATDLQRYINGVVLNTALALYLGDIPVQKVYCGSVQVWP